MKKIFVLSFFLFIINATYCQTDSLIAVAKNGKWGFIDYSGKTIIPFKYQSVATTFYDGAAIVQEKGKWGMINREGKYIIKPKLDSIIEFSGLNKFLVAWKGGHKVVYLQEKQLVASGYVNVITMDKYIIVQQQETGKWGYIDSLGKPITPTKYDNWNYFSDNLACVQVGDTYGYINQKGETVLPFRYAYASQFSDDYAVVRLMDDESGAYRFINKQGELMFGRGFYSADSFSEGLAYVSNGEEDYYIDTKGNMVFKVDEGGYYSDFDNGFAAFSPAGGYLWGLLNRQGKVIVPPKFIDVVSYYEGAHLIDVKTADSLIGFYDTLGVERIAPKYNEWGYFCEGMAAVRLNNHWGFIDSLGNEAILPKYEGRGCPYFNEGLAAVQLNGKYGVVDKKDSMVIPFVYDSIGGFCNGLAPVKQKGKWGFIDGAGVLQIPLIYDNYCMSAGIFMRLEMSAIEKIGETSNGEGEILIMAAPNDDDVKISIQRSDE